LWTTTAALDGAFVDHATRNDLKRIVAAAYDDN